MRVWCLGLAAAIVLTLAACGGVQWVHPTKPQDAFAQDYNACENQAMLNPRYQGGTKLVVQQATERCLEKKGWVLPE
ncbi:MAG TPA: hypothetical protein VJ692_05300 [Nitrospiraceae bacterium]|nr:hypothetical protein [Nitrospiraceae bacterium]